MMGLPIQVPLSAEPHEQSFGVLKSKQNLPHFQLEYNVFKSDERVGGQALASGHKMISLSEGTRTMTLEDQVMKAKLRVEVRKRN